ncbi:YceI family protein [Amphritea sp. 2_MG-2023]|uniref:YceI family protein n=1 Tax=Amphritea TaxID=515417 RepID=UPI001C07B43F|nr:MULTISPECIES: YceI family protein [Amphritea]MBU2965881.1 YceI family protein [Amphritea atlantica]MDO6417971.1 YceI family protein [Amphritea sp. 2_MG-2023]
MNLKTIIAGALLAGTITSAQAADYVIDTGHASVSFRIQHLGYSWLEGRFNDFSGQFSYDAANPSASKITVNINTPSIDSNHAERDKHIRGDDFLAVKDFPEAKFESTSFTPATDVSAVLSGNLTLHGVTKAIDIQVSKVGEGKDPWGGYRAGFTGTTQLNLKDFDINYNLGPASESVYLNLNVEGIRQ